MHHAPICWYKYLHEFIYTYVYIIYVFIYNKDMFSEFYDLFCLLLTWEFWEIIILRHSIPEKMDSGRMVWTLGRWMPGRLDYKHLNTWALDAWTLDDWTLGLWTPPLWTLGLWTLGPRQIYPFLVASFVLLFRRITIKSQIKTRLDIDPPEYRPILVLMKNLSRF